MRGLLLSLDALVAVLILISFATVLGGITLSYSAPQSRYQRMYYAGKDILHVLEGGDVSNFENISPVGYYIETGVITPYDMNKTMLDTIGSLWSKGNITERYSCS